MLNSSDLQLDRFPAGEIQALVDLLEAGVAEVPAVFAPTLGELRDLLAWAIRRPYVEDPGPEPVVDLARHDPEQLVALKTDLGAIYHAGRDPDAPDRDDDTGALARALAFEISLVIPSRLERGGDPDELLEDAADDDWTPSA